MTQETIDLDTIRVAKRPKKIPNYMKPNAAWLAREMDGAEAQRQFEEAQ